MKVTYDQATDTLTIVLKDGVPVAESDEDRGGAVLDYDADGGLACSAAGDAQAGVSHSALIGNATVRSPKGTTFCPR